MEKNRQREDDSRREQQRQRRAREGKHRKKRASASACERRCRRERERVGESRKVCGKWWCVCNKVWECVCVRKTASTYAYGRDRS